MNMMADCYCEKCRSRSVAFVLISRNCGSIEFDFRLQAICGYDGAKVCFGELLSADFLVARLLEGAVISAFCSSCTDSEDTIIAIYEDGLICSIDTPNHGRLLIREVISEHIPADVALWTLDEVLLVL